MITPLTLIVLNTRAYRETSLLVNAYTDIWGRADFVVKGIRTPRHRAAASLFHPLSILEAQTYYRTGRELHSLKEFQKKYLLEGLCSDVRKSSISLFIGEFLYKTVRESEKNPALFRFMEETVLNLDRAGEDLADIHLYFATRLGRYLGYEPALETYSPERPFFHMKDACFRESPDTSFAAFDIEDSALMQKILSRTSREKVPLFCSGTRRNHFLNSLIAYYGYHMGKSPEIKSLEVLHQVFL
ncbi:MAG: DNA repair protein RecO [Bacteroidales bacterium]|jgi:DNA repair protein RecO (recombination protein O)